MSSETWEPRSPTIDALQQILDLARESAKAPGPRNDAEPAKDSQRLAKITMLMAMHALEAGEKQTDPIEDIITRRFAEEKEKRKAGRAKERARMEQELQERDKYWEKEVEHVRREVERRMTEERELECEWQETKYETKRRRDEAEQKSIELAATDAVNKAKEKIAKAREERDLARKEAVEARREVAKERERAERAEQAQKEQSARDEADRQALEEQQESVAWGRYENQWLLLKRIATIAPEGGAFFRFDDLPWPTVAPPRDPSAITSEEVAGFLFSGPALEEGVTLKSRIKDCLLRWHPDKFSGRWIKYIVESDRTRVIEGVDAVVRAGNRVMTEYSEHKAQAA